MPSQPLEAVELALRVADYGLETESSFALIAASQIALDNPWTSLPSTGTVRALASPIDVRAWLRSATAFAPDDPAVRKLVAALLARAESRPRGAVGGVRVASYLLEPHASHELELPFMVGQAGAIRVRVRGDGTMECSVRNQRGSTLAADRATAYCFLNFKPAGTGRVRLRIVNTGAASVSYVVVTN